MKKLILILLCLVSTPIYAKCIDSFKYGQIYRQNCEFCDYMTITKIDSKKDKITYKQFAYENDVEKLTSEHEKDCKYVNEYYNLIFELPSKEKALYILKFRDSRGILLVNDWEYMLRLFGEHIDSKGKIQVHDKLSEEEIKSYIG